MKYRITTRQGRYRIEVWDDETVMPHWRQFGSDTYDVPYMAMRALAMLTESTAADSEWTEMPND